MSDFQADIVVGIDFGMVSTSVAYSTAPEWSEPRTIQHWPGKPAHELRNKVDSSVSYDFRTGNVAAWGFLCNPEDETNEYNALFKLNLDPDYRDPIEGAPTTREARLWYRDFLGCLYSYIMSYFRNTIARFEAKRIDFVFSIPLSWRNNAQMVPQMEQVIHEAGFGQTERERSSIYMSEAEAAAFHAFHTLPNNPPQAFLVCDAGDATTDVSAWKRDPRAERQWSFVPIAWAEGEAVGSTLIDWKIRVLIKARLTSISEYLSGDLDTIITQMMQYKFDAFKRCLGSVEMDIQKLFLDVPGLSPGRNFPTAGIEDSRMVISRADILAAFVDQLEKLCFLIDKQLHIVSQSQPDVKISHLILLGALGASPYIQTQIKSRYDFGHHPGAQRIAVVTTEEPPLATVHGLVRARKSMYHGLDRIYGRAPMSNLPPLYPDVMRAHDTDRPLDRALNSMKRLFKRTDVSDHKLRKYPLIPAEDESKLIPDPGIGASVRMTPRKTPVAEGEPFDDAASISSVSSYQPSVSSYRTGNSSYQSSIFSSVGSRSSASSVDFTVSQAIDLFVDLFLKDQDLFSHLKEANDRMTSDKFVRNQQRLLKGFYLDLAAEARDAVQTEASRLLQSRPNREAIASKIRGSLVSTAEFENLRSRSQNQANVDMISRLLQSTGRSSTYTVDERIRESTMEPSDVTRSAVERSQGNQIDTSVEEKSEDNESDSDSSVASDYHDPQNPNHLILDIVLEKTKEFLFGGVAFKTYKENVRRWVQPDPCTQLQDLISRKAIRQLEQLLETEFDAITNSEFVWLKDLREIGYEYHDLAELLVDGEADTPWLYFDFNDHTRFELSSDYHQYSCIHLVSERTEQTSTPGAGVYTLVHQKPSSRSEDQDRIRHDVSELCGLAGVIPASRSPSDWDGWATFEGDNNSTARISYSHVSQEVDSTLLERLQRIGRRFGNAFGLLQDSGVCCNSFTILGWTNKNSLKPAVEVRRIEAEQTKQFLAKLDGFKDQEPQELRALATDAVYLIGEMVEFELPLFLLDNDFPRNGKEVQRALNLVSVAMQALCLGLMSYSRAHIDRLHPFFLVHPLDRVVLQGSWDDEPEPFIITAELIRLTCMGNLTKQPVLVFEREALPRPASPDGRYDVLARPEDVVDTWGPGLLITNSGLMRESNAFGIELGGGIFTSSSSSSLHWEKLSLRKGLDHVVLPSRSFSLKSKILIGTIQINDACPLKEQIKEEEARQACSDYLHILGTAPPRWYHQSTQVGLQGGQYAVLSVGAQFEKREGVTAKDKILRGFESTRPRISLQDLEAYYGLQISLCTGVAHRVPLRLLLADSVTAYVESYVPRPFEWELFKGDLLDNLRGPNFGTWLLGLPSEDTRLSVIYTLANLLNHLRDTGLDSDGELNIAWIRPGEDQLCFKMQCDDRNLWAKILEDTEHCATFACITTQCFITDSHRCRGPAVHGWLNVSELLATEICRYVASGSRPVLRGHQPFVLQDKASYWIGPVNAGLLASVSLVGFPAAQPRLEVSRSWMKRVPEKYRGLLLSKQKATREHIRERGAITGQSTIVAVCARLM